MSLPIVMIFNRHWDVTPQLLIKNLLPELAAEGYDTFCKELSNSRTGEDAFKMMEERLQEGAKVMNLFNNLVDKKLSREKRLNDCTTEELQEALPRDLDSTFTRQLAITVKTFPAIKLSQDNFQFAKKRAFSIFCIDDSNSLGDIRSNSHDVHLEGAMILKTCSRRDIVMANRLFHLHAEKKGIIVSLGCMHFKSIVERLKEKGLNDEDIVCHFPHSSYSMSRDLDDIKYLHGSGTILSDKTSCATTSEEIHILGQKILEEIRSKNKRYLSEISGNCHSQFLSEFFKVNFKAFLRHEYHVDALLPFAQVKEIKLIQQDLEDLSIQNHLTNQNNQNYLVIPNVNTNEVGHRIRLLPYKI